MSPPRPRLPSPGIAARAGGLLLAALALLTGCAAVPPAPSEEVLLRDAAFAPPAEAVGADDLFTVSPAMRGFIDSAIVPAARRRGLQRALVDALNDRAGLKLEYDSSLTRTAAQAFDARAGNCLSLVLMTSALARELGVPVGYRLVLLEETWSRQSDLVFASQHVNLVLGRPLGTDASLESAGLIVDFVPAEQIRRARTRDISEETLVAMFLNNRAAEALAAGRLDTAYWWVREAVRRAPGYSAAVNTLAVVYLRRGLAEDAATVLQSLLGREPDNPNAVANLLAVRERQGRADDAAQLRVRLAQLEPVRPFQHFDEGLAALRGGDTRAARDAFQRELRRDADNHEVHHWLAIAHLLLGELPEARRHMGIALRNSTTRSDHDLYAAKLEHLLARRKDGRSVQ